MATEARICPHCGKEIARDRQRLCNNCGLDFTAGDAWRVPSPPPNRQAVFRGVSEADSLRQAETDVVDARQNGYAPVSQAWSEDAGLKVLTVEYRRTGPAVVRSAAPATGWATPAAVPDAESKAKIAGAAWLVGGALVAALAIQQWNAAEAFDALRKLGASLGVSTTLPDLRPYAIFNAIEAVVTLVLGYRLLRYPTRGLANWSIALAVLSVVGGVVQPSALANVLFLGSIAAAVVAGFVSYQARNHLL